LLFLLFDFVGGTEISNFRKLQSCTRIELYIGPTLLTKLFILKKKKKKNSCVNWNLSVAGVVVAPLPSMRRTAKTKCQTDAGRPRQYITTTPPQHAGCGGGA